MRTALKSRARALSPRGRLAVAVVGGLAVAVAAVVVLSNVLSSSPDPAYPSVSGARNVRGGVPVEYAHTKKGAAAAAVNYSAALGGVSADPARAEPIVAALAAPLGREALLSRIRADARIFARRLPGRRVTVTVKPVAHYVAAYDRSSTVIEVASTGTTMISPGGNPVPQCFLHHVELAWSDRDWKASAVYRLQPPTGDCVPAGYTRVHAR